MSNPTKANDTQKSDRKLAAVAEFVRKVGGLEQARQAIEAVNKLRKAG